MSRLPVIDLSQLPPMTILEVISTEDILAARMAKLIERWNANDPPAGALYDVDSLEFDPIKINQECSTYFELLVRDRVNQAARGVTLAFAVNGNLDAIASRYPGGVPRIAGESDSVYRRRVWLSSNLLSPHGVFESYIFWALTADPTLHDATATTIPGTGNINVTIMAQGVPTITNPLVVKSGENFWQVQMPNTNPMPSDAQKLAVYNYISSEARKGLTDVVSVMAPKISNTKYRIRIWLFPGFDADITMGQVGISIGKLIEQQRWLGYDHTRMAIDGAVNLPGVYNAVIDEPAKDVIVDANGVVKVTDVQLTFIGRGE